MKRIAWLFLAALCAVTLAQAQSSEKAMEMHGTICRASCVTQVNNVATCDRTCTDKSGDAVFVDDQGNLHTIAADSQDMCQSHMAKHVTMMAVPINGNENANDLRIREIRNDSGRGLSASWQSQRARNAALARLHSWSRCGCAFVEIHGNAHDEGAREFWDPVKKYWADSQSENRTALHFLVEPKSTRYRSD